MLKGGVSAAFFSGATEAIIASGAAATGQMGNLLTGTFKEFNINNASWSGSVGNIGENVLPTAMDLMIGVFQVNSSIEE